LDTTTSTPISEYFDEYEFNQQHPDSIHKKSNVTEKMSKNIYLRIDPRELFVLLLGGIAYDTRAR